MCRRWARIRARTGLARSTAIATAELSCWRSLSIRPAPMPSFTATAVPMRTEEPLTLEWRNDIVIDVVTRRLTCVTYNIHSGVGVDKRYDLGRIRRVLNDERPDIAALQELECRS